MKKGRQVFFILFLLPFFVFMASEEGSASSNLIDFLGKSINFIILFGGIAYFLYKPLRNYLEKRSQDIKNSLEEAENSRREADKKLKAVEVRLEGLGEKVTKIKKEAEIEGHRERERIINEAKREAEKIKQQTQKEIEMLIEGGSRELKEFTAEMATNLAEERIKKAITKQDHEHLINKSIQKLSEFNEKSNTDKKIHPGTR
ncbi:MAG: F0F1 ATP synthase subunit B [Candidatus Aminicenantaceae bacterium]